MTHRPHRPRRLSELGAVCGVLGVAFVGAAAGLPACDSLVGLRTPLLETDAAASDGGPTDDSATSTSPDGACAQPSCPGGCTDLETDRHNCGACGHDCMGGSCASGSCQPFVLVAGSPAAIAVDGARLYWADWSNGNVEACSLPACADGGVTLFNGASVGQSDQFLVGPLALQGGRIYFVVNGTLSYTARVYSCPTTGCDFTGVPVPVGIPAPPGYGLGFGVATDTTSVYWGTYDTIYACPLSGCNGSPTTVATGLFAQDPLRGLAQSGGYLYFTSQYSVETCPVAGGCDCTGMGSCATGASEGVSATAIAARPGGVYATFASAGAVVALGTGRTPVLPFAAARGVGDVATDGDHVYFTSQEANGSISACALDSCDGGPSVIASNLGTLGALAVDATRVYVVVGVSAGTGTSFGLATNNGNAIVAVAK